MVTGPQAERVFAVSKALNVKYTRIDLQVTIEMETPVRSLASDHYQAPNLTGAMERGKIYLSLINSPNGDTLYLNKRTSPSFGRMYDKSRDYMGVLGQFWRWEVELKEEISDRMGRVLEAMTEYTEVAADYVAGWYADRDLCVPLGKRDRVSIPETFPASSGFAQTLAWLNKQVRPSLEILRQAGLSEDAEKALGVQLTFPDYDDT
jgi:DNA relaxase NicK